MYPALRSTGIVSVPRFSKTFEHPNSAEGDFRLTLNEKTKLYETQVRGEHVWHALATPFSPSAVRKTLGARPQSDTIQDAYFTALYLSRFAGATIEYDEDLRAYVLPHETGSLSDIFKDFYSNLQQAEAF